jgi:hypothetical protein
MNLKKLFLATLMTFLVGGILFTYNQNNQLVPQAAATETKRIWAIARESWWFNDGVGFGVATATNFVGDSAQNYTTYIMQRDINNFDSGISNEFSGSQSYAYYVDVPINVGYVEFFREANPANRFNFSGWSNYTIGMKYVFNGFTTEFSDFSFQTTKVVSDFIVQTEDLQGNCTFSNIELLISNYNSLASFEQNQFDNSVFGESSGIERLNYLITISGATTPLN